MKKIFFSTIVIAFLVSCSKDENHCPIVEKGLVPAVVKTGFQARYPSDSVITWFKKDRGTIYIQTIDKNAYDFFDQLDKQKLAQYNPFVEPIFLRDGQFGSKAIGYFSAMVKSRPALYIFPE